MSVNYNLNSEPMANKKQQPQEKSNTLKSLRYKLQLMDGLWSIPLAFLVFALSGTMSVAYFNDAIISTEYIQYIVLAALVMVFANFVVFLGIRFNFRALQREIYNKEVKYEINTYLTTWQKVVLYLLLYAFYFAAYLYILHMLMTVTA
jgi:hypothetical protein